MHVWIAGRVAQVGGGHPTNVANTDMLMKMGGGEDWFPGTQYGENSGRKRVITGVQALAVANCARAKKAKGGDPTYGHVCGNCPEAVMNPATGKPAAKRAVR